MWNLGAVPNRHERRAELMNGVVKSDLANRLKFPTGIELQSRAQEAAGCAGTDGWSAQEIKHLPLGTLSASPSCLKSLPKKVKYPLNLDSPEWFASPNLIKLAILGSMLVIPDPLRLFLCSGDCGLPPSAKSTPLRHWLHSILIPEIGGISREDIYNNLIEVYDNFCTHGFILTLDYSKAFDCW